MNNHKNIKLKFEFLVPNDYLPAIFPLPNNFCYYNYYGFSVKKKF